jgi:electron transport complex protein RnfE
MNASAPPIPPDESWKNHPGLLHLFGLSPLLAMSTTVMNALGLGLMTLLVTTGSSLMISLLRRQQTAPALRLLVFVLVLAALTSGATLLLQAYAYPWYLTLGTFAPLIVSNCALLGRAESHASQHPPLPATLDGLVTGLRFLLLIIMLGTIREVLGTGALFAGFDQWLPLAAGWRVEIFAAESSFLLALTAPGAFLLLGCLIAGKQVLDQRSAKPADVQQLVVPGSKRVRVTGKV